MISFWSPSHFSLINPLYFNVNNFDRSYRLKKKGKENKIILRLTNNKNKVVLISTLNRISK